MACYVYSYFGESSQVLPCSCTTSDDAIEWLSSAINEGLVCRIAIDC